MGNDQYGVIVVGGGIMGCCSAYYLLSLQDNLSIAIIEREYLGGHGLGIYYLNREIDPACDPLGKENLMVMATGPLTGTKAPTGARYMITTKSPLTGAITCSNSGGQFPTHLKRTGLDALLISGAAEKQEFAGYDPRAEQGMGLAYATSPIGASHMRGDPAYFEMLDEYYQARQWTIDGVPTDEKLKQLGIA